MSSAKFQKETTRLKKKEQAKAPRANNNIDVNQVKKISIDLDFKHEHNKFMELSLADLEAELYDQVHLHLLETPVWQDDAYQQKLQDSTDEGDGFELEEYDLLDSPDDETNIETGEGEQTDSYSDVPDAENFFDYVWRRFNADFKDENPGLRNIVRKYLEKWKYPYFPLADNLELKEEHRLLLRWFESLGCEFGAMIDKTMVKRYPIDIPDIIFNVDHAGDLSYEINMGILDRLIVPDNAEGTLKISEAEKGSGIPMGILNQLIMVRRANLCLLAEYLKSEQKDFILAPSLSEGVRNLKLIQQKDFILHLETLGIEKTKDEMTRIIKGKHIQIPYCNMVLPARICFGRPVKNLKEIADAERVLHVAFNLHITRNSGAPLTAPDQAAIISAVLGCEYSSNKVSRTIWKKMRERIAKEHWPKLRIIGKDEQGNTIKNVRNKLSPQDLHRLCEEVKAEMER